MAFEALDVAVHFLFERIDQGVNLRVRAFHDYFNAPVRQIADVPADIVLQGDVLSGVSESNPLDTAGEMTSTSMHWCSGLDECCVH